MDVTEHTLIDQDHSLMSEDTNQDLDTFSSETILSESITTFNEKNKQSESETGSGAPRTSGSLVPISGKSITSSIEPIHQWSEEKVLQTIQHLVKKANVSWTSNQQRDALMTVLNTKRDVLTILTTGSGKSMLAIVPAILEHNEITVLVLPLKSLVVDYIRKLTEMEVPFVNYRGDSTPRGQCTANLIIVSVDAAQTEQWSQWIAEINQTKKVRRYCFDEGHYPIMDSGFRDALREVYTIRSQMCQLVVFSGTLPPSSQDIIIDEFMLNSPLIFRTSSTNRPELQIIKFPQTSRIPAYDLVVSVWKHHSPHFSKQDRALVYVPFIDFGRELAKKLGCEFYNSKDTDKAKNQIYFKWRTGVHRIMVSTSAFSCGNDYAHIPLVIHAGTPRTMMGYIQEISRGGRNQQKTACYLIPVAKWKLDQSTAFDDMLGVTHMEQMCFGNTTVCLRQQITLYNDGKAEAISCNMLSDNHPCSTCDPTVGLVHSQKIGAMVLNPLKRKHQVNDTPPVHPNKRVTSNQVLSSTEMMDRMQLRRQQTEDADIRVRESLRNQLNLLKGMCVLCWWSSKTSASEITNVDTHEFKHCDLLNGPFGEGYYAFKQSIKYRETKICFVCHVPSFADKLHGPFRGPNSCEYLDIILPTVYYAYVTYRNKLEQKFQTSWSSDSNFASWLCGKTLNQKEKTNVVTVFLTCREFMEI